MASYPLKNDTIVTIGILVLDAAGDVVPAPVSDAFSVTSSDPTKLNAVIGQDINGHPAVVINALVPSATGLSFTVSDSAGLAAFTEEVEITDDQTPRAIGLDLATVTSTTQPVPAAPAP